jgi:hypothetical protein
MTFSGKRNFCIFLCKQGRLEFSRWISLLAIWTLDARGHTNQDWCHPRQRGSGRRVKIVDMYFGIEEAEGEWRWKPNATWSETEHFLLFCKSCGCCSEHGPICHLFELILVIHANTSNGTNHIVSSLSYVVPWRRGTSFSETAISLSMWSIISKRVNIAIWASCYWAMSLRAYVSI